MLDLSLTDVRESGEPDERLYPMEGPLWTFSLTGRNGASWVHDGGFSIRDLATGDELRFRPFHLEQDVLTGELELVGEDDRARLQLDHARVLQDAASVDPHTVRILGFDLRISRASALLLQRPELEDALIGTGQWVAQSIGEANSPPLGSSHPDRNDTAPLEDEQASGCITDAKLAELYQLESFGRIGSFPTGEIGLSMTTTICNIGDCSLPWFAPMNEAHPGVVMHLYRLADGRFEQIGLSGVKHGYFPLGVDGCGNHCTDLPNDLGIGCQDTYGASSNADRTWLAPRDEWSGYYGTWECTGSHFADGEPDCTRRHGGAGHDPVEHRLRVRDADLADASADYYVEAMYIVAEDVDRFDNYGYRPTTFVRTGDDYVFSLGGGFSALEGPALGAWDAEIRTGTFPGEGRLLLGYTVTDIGGGAYAYEYALLNLDSDLAVKSFRVPVGSGPIDDIGFHDPNGDELDDWNATLVGNELVWETASNPVRWGHLYNFRFVSTEPGAPGTISCGSFVGNSTATIDALVPGGVSSVSSPSAEFSFQLRPNPMSTESRIGFTLQETNQVDLEIYDSAGRQVRRLLIGSRPPGTHEVEWDGTDDRGVALGSGVYYCRLKAGSETAVRTIRRVR